MYSRRMLLSQMTGDGGNAITVSAILWLRYEHSERLGKCISYIYSYNVV